VDATWPIDTELITALKASMSSLSSSVTVVCRPRAAGSAASFKDVRREIDRVVREAVRRFFDFYGFRGAGLIVACYGPAVGVIASIQALEAIKILSGRRHAVSHYLTVVELWDSSIRQVDVSNLRDQVDCPTCKRGEFAWLAGQEGSRSAVLCGRNAVQLSFPGKTVSLDALATQWEKLGQVSRNPFLLRLKLQEYELTVFPDGRAIISGTSDLALARTLYAKYVGT
jgi:hypothetical protein